MIVGVHAGRTNTEVRSGSEPSHHLLDSGVLEWQLELISFAAIVVDNGSNAVAEGFRHLQLLPVDPDVLQYDIIWNVPQVDAKHLVVGHRL